jgi:predicted ATP-grasp superfamily ATP-dependent carboligase
MSQAANIGDQRGEIVIAYTVWSRKRGAGKDIIKKLAEWARENKFERLVTLSPLTPMATHFHIRNGAKQTNINEDTQNFEYKL